MSSNCSRTRTLLAALALALPISAARATMPLLTDAPKPPTLQSCQKWAASQDEDALDMWGALKDGGSSRDAGLMRLTLSCLGDENPEIVGFGSSAGFDEAFCTKHSDWGICRREAERNKGAPACFVADPTNTPMNYRTSPNGKVLGSIANGQTVNVVDTKVDANGKRWAFISDGGSGNTLGWAFEPYIRCGR